jgi:hypothetical protein
LPKYSWSGRTSRGEEITGELAAGSKEAALDTLRKQGILVATLESWSEAPDYVAARTLPARDKAGVLTRLVFGAATLVGALLFVTISRGTVVRCERARDKSVTCSVETNIAGYYLLDIEEIPHVEEAAAENSTIETRDSRANRTISSTSHQVIVRGAKRTVRSKAMSYSYGASADAIAAGVNRFLASNDRDYRAWQVEIVPLAVAGAFAVVALLSFWAAIRRLF